MTDKKPSAAQKPTKSDTELERQARQSAALRANLKKRKSQRHVRKNHEKDTDSNGLPI